MLAGKPPNAAALQTFIGKNNLPVVPAHFQAAGAPLARSCSIISAARVMPQVANQPADRLLDSADVVITIGYDPVEYWPPLWNAKSQHKILHIDVLPTDLDNYYSPYVELTGDIAQTSPTLTLQLQRTQKSALSQGNPRNDKRRTPACCPRSGGADEVPIHQVRLVHELQRFLGSDVTVCLDMGSFHLWIARHLYNFRPRQSFSSRTASRPWASLFLGASLPRSSTSGEDSLDLRR